MPLYERLGEWHNVPMPITLDLVVRSALLNALAYTDGNQKKAATYLGISRRMMCYKMDSYGIPREKCDEVKHKRLLGKCQLKKRIA